MNSPVARHGDRCLHVPSVVLLSFVLLGCLQSAPAARAQEAQTPAGICVAIMLPSVQGVDGSATEVAKAVRELLSSFLTGPSMRTVAIDARLPALATEEAKEKQCDNLLIATLNRKHSGGSGLGKALGQAAGTAAWYVPYGGSTAAYVARGVTVATAQAVSSVAASTRAKDELQLDYRVVTSSNALRVPAASEKQKAKTDGEDVLTPLVEKAAQTIATGLMKK
jgi:hypothetical protein